MSRLLLFTFLMGVITPLVAKEYSGTITKKSLNSPFETVSLLEKQVSMNIDIKLSWKVWTLYGEPVKISHLRWKLNHVTVRNVDGRDATVFQLCRGGNSSNCIPKGIASDLKIIDVDFFAYNLLGSKNKNPVGIILNPGVNSRPGVNSAGQGKASYNTPGSPSWEQFIVYHSGFGYQRGLNSIDFDNINYFQEDIAKKTFKEGIQLDKLEIATFTGGYSALFSYLNELEYKKSTNNVQKNIDSQIKKVAKSTQDDIFAEFESEFIEQEFQPELQQFQSQLIENTEQIANYINHEKKLLAAVKSRVEDKTLPLDPMAKLSLFVENKRYGYKNKNGKTVIEAQYKYASDFSEGLAVVLPVNAKGYGYINKAGELVIASNFYVANKFSEGLAAVLLSAEKPLYGFINRQGKLVIKTKYYYVENFKQGRALVRYNFVADKSKSVCRDRDAYYSEGYIDTRGNTVGEHRRKKTVIRGEFCLQSE